MIENTEVLSLMQGELKRQLHYEPETGIFTRLVAKSNNKLKVGSIAGTRNTAGYLLIKINKKQYMCHVLAALYMTGSLPVYPQDEVDHINGIKSDNRWDNLRVGDRSMNQRNTKKQRNNTSGVTGVHWNNFKRKWESGISAGGKSIYLGAFIEFHEAVNARKNAEVLYGYDENHGRIA